MNVRSLLWQILLWVGVAAFLVSTLFTAIVNDDLTGILGFVMFPVVGAIILSSRPGNGVGWLLYGIGLAWTVSGPMSSGELSPDASWAELVLISVLSWFGWGSIPLIGVVFPTGRIETRLGRIAAAVLVGYLTVATVASITSPRRPGSVVDNPLAVPALEAPNGVILGPLGILVFLGAIIAIVVDLAIRWRRASGVQTLQYRWLVFSLAVVVVIVGTSGLLNLLYPDAPWVSVVATCLSLSTNLIPISIGIAVTRHGLYEIGRVVSRTVAFAVVTLVVIGVYAGVVTSASLLLPEQSTIAVAVATLVAAAVFLPVLRWVQRGVERRFDRERYNAQQVVDEFGDRLRTGADPEGTAPDLVAAVERTLQPRAVGVWTIGGAG